VKQPLLNPDAMFGKSAAGAAAKAAEYAALRTKEAVASRSEKSYYTLVLAHGNLETIAQAVKSAETHHAKWRRRTQRGSCRRRPSLIAGEAREMEEQRSQRGWTSRTPRITSSTFRLEDATGILPTDSLTIAEGDLDVSAPR